MSLTSQRRASHTLVCVSPVSFFHTKNMFGLTRVVLDETAVKISQFLSADVSGWVIRGLEVQVILSAAEEL